MEKRRREEVEGYLRICIMRKKRGGDMAYGSVEGIYLFDAEIIFADAKEPQITI